MSDTIHKKQALSVIMVMLITLFGMTLFEWTKQLFRPDISIWQSHIVTIFFSTFVATLAAYFVMRRYLAVRQESLHEKRLRQRLEKQVMEGRFMEAKLRKLSLAVEQSPNSIIITDSEGLIEYVNPRFTAVSGYAEKDVIGKTPSLLKSGEIPQSTFEVLWNTIKAGRAWRGELKNKAKSGTPYWDYVSISPLRDAAGEITHFIGIQTNITELRHTEEKLRESNNRVRAIVETAAEGIITVDHKGRIESFNPAAERIFGYPRYEVIGKKVDLLIPSVFDDKGGKFFAPFLLSSKGKVRGSGMELVGRRKDDTLFPMQLAVGEFKDGVEPFFAGIVRDITDWKRMETTLREERNFIDAVLATSAALIVVMDREGRMVRFNKACEEAMGYTFDQVKGQSFFKRFLFPDERETVKDGFDRLRTSHVPTQFESSILTKDGKRRLISWNNTALHDKEGEAEYIIGTGIDITERRRAEIQAREHQAELAHVDRLSLMGEMATGLAHELNQPLTSIYAYSQACLRMLRAGNERSEKFVNAVEQTAQRAEQAGEIIRRLRHFVRKQESKKTNTNMDQIITKAMSFIEAEARDKGITVSLDIDQRLPPVLADSVQIQQVLLNLMRNAIESMMLSDCDKRKLMIGAARIADGELRVTVTDTGQGVNENLLERIFEAFYTTKTYGMGMGLAISRSIIEDHGGRLWAESTVGGGASFHFTLPAEGEIKRGCEI